jgi:acyl carrier protein
VTNDSPPSLSDDLVSFIRDEVAAGVDADVDADTDLVMSGLVDSLGVVMIVENLEQRLDIRIDPVDVVIEHFSSVSTIIEYLGRRDDCSIVKAG